VNLLNISYFPNCLDGAAKILSNGIENESWRVRIAEENFSNAESVARVPGACPIEEKSSQFQDISQTTVATLRRGEEMARQAIQGGGRSPKGILRRTGCHQENSTILRHFNRTNASLSRDCAYAHLNPRE